MNKKNQHIELWIGRIMFFGLFLFLLTAFNGNDSNGISMEESSDVKYVSELDRAGIPVSSTTLPVFDISLSTSDSDYHNADSDYRILVQKANLKLKLQFNYCSDNLNRIKPEIIRSFSCLNISTLNDEDCTLIS